MLKWLSWRQSKANKNQVSTSPTFLNSAGKKVARKGEGVGREKEQWAKQGLQTTCRVKWLLLRFYWSTLYRVLGLIPSVSFKKKSSEYRIEQILTVMMGTNRVGKYCLKYMELINNDSDPRSIVPHSGWVGRWTLLEISSRKCARNQHLEQSSECRDGAGKYDLEMMVGSSFTGPIFTHPLCYKPWPGFLCL